MNAAVPSLTSLRRSLRLLAIVAVLVGDGDTDWAWTTVDDNMDDLVNFLEDNGGDQRNVGADYIEAYVPVTLLGAVSERSGVMRVRKFEPQELGQDRSAFIDQDTSVRNLCLGMMSGPGRRQGSGMWLEPQGGDSLR